MTNITKLLFCTIVTFVFISAPVQAEVNNSPPIFNKSKNSNNGKMKSVSWNTPAPKEDLKPVEEIEEIKDSQEEVEVELTDDQKLWKKYQDLAYGNNEETPEEEIEITSEDGNVTKEKESKSPMGIASIIADYKKSQENKGKMNSRSFGRID